MILVYGPAYVDTVLQIDRPLVPGTSLLLDQSIQAATRTPRDDGRIVLEGPTGDEVTLLLPAHARDAGATFALSEPILARAMGAGAPLVRAEFPVTSCVRQLGGMGAGYASALGGMLRMAIGNDAEGRAVRAECEAYDVPAVPSIVPGAATDTSMVIMSPRGDKLAVGVRDAMVRWEAGPMDEEAGVADLLVFCGAPNALARDVLAAGTVEGIVMCAPAMRNVCDTDVPLASLAANVNYLAMNALEWEHLPGRGELWMRVPVVTVTDGPDGSHILQPGEEDIAMEAFPFDGDPNTNRAGETYAAAFVSMLRREAPGFPHGRVERGTLRMCGYHAAAMAMLQLRIADFGFPEGI
jgi:hypothetical protein